MLVRYDRGMRTFSCSHFVTDLLSSASHYADSAWHIELQIAQPHFSPVCHTNPVQVLILGFIQKIRLSMDKHVLLTQPTTLDCRVEQRLFLTWKKQTGRSGTNSVLAFSHLCYFFHKLSSPKGVHSKVGFLLQFECFTWFFCFGVLQSHSPAWIEYRGYFRFMASCLYVTKKM